MSPLAALTAIVFGSSAAISFGLIATLIVFAVLQSEQPQLQRELAPLLQSCLWFLALAGVSGVALYSALKQQTWRGWAQGAMWLAIGIVVAVYWPR